jgi:PilZ domain
MRGLPATGATATLNLGEEAIDCRVVAVAGHTATLEPYSPADAAYIPSLGRPAVLAFTGAAGERVRARGVVRRDLEEGRLRFLAGDPAGVPQRRRTARVAAELPVALEPAPGGERHGLVTNDVGLGGLGVRVGAWAPAPGAVIGFELSLPSPPPVAGTACVRRVECGMAGLEFAHIAPGDRARLAAFVIAAGR